MARTHGSLRTPEQDEIRQLKDELFFARLTIISLMPERQRRILESYSGCVTRDDTYRWENRIAEELLAMVAVIPTFSGDRAYCPLCGEGSSSGYDEGYSLPVGLTRHLTGWGRSRRCAVIAAAAALARDSWNFRFARAEQEQAAKKAELLVERKASELLFLLGPNSKPVLYDEGISSWHRLRNTDEMAWAEQRLNELGFKVSAVDRAKSYVDEQERYIVYADPRRKGEIALAAYARLAPTKAKGARPRFKTLGIFCIPDRWKNEIPKKYQAWVQQVTSAL